MAHHSVDPDDFPALRDFVRGYLHQDLHDTYGSAAGAAASFLADASPAEKETLRLEVRRFRGATRALSVHKLGRILTKTFGGSWAPADDAERDAVFDRLEAHVA